MYVLKNNSLKIAVKNEGAELCDISSVKNKTQFMWNANPDVWGSYAPNLFPIIGALKDNSYYFENQKYHLPKHGFIRNNKSMQLFEQHDDRLVFGLIYNEDLQKVYPFKFEFYISYTLKHNTIKVKHTVKNVDNKTMYFSVGGHPAFKCPVFDEERYEDYILEFEHAENSKTHLLNMENGLVSSKTKHIFDNSNALQLTHELFDNDALIFKDLKSRKVALKSRFKGEILSVSYQDFDYLGIWAKPNGDYVCIEPWLGVADSEDTNQKLTTKEGIISLEANQTFEATYQIEINERHLA